MSTTAPLGKTLKAVALVEGSKGAVVLLAGLSILSLVHKNLQATAEHIVALLHLNPAKGFPRIFIDYSAKVTSGELTLVAALALAYTIARFIEAYGLWNSKPWAEWFAIISCLIYIPFEIYEIWSGRITTGLLMLLLNVVIVGIMATAIRQRRQADR